MKSPSVYRGAFFVNVRGISYIVEHNYSKGFKQNDQFKSYNIPPLYVQPLSQISYLDTQI